MGAAIAQIVAEEHPVPMRFIGIRDAHMESGSVEELMVRHKFAAADIVHAAREAVAAKTKGMRMSLLQDLSKRESRRQAPSGSAVSGAGWIGGGFVTQVSRMKGMEVTVLADTDTALARQVFESTGVPADAIVEAESVSKAQDALRKGKRVVTGSYSLAAQLRDVDIVVDVTPSPAIGAETAWSCIQNRKNVVMVNIEADVTVGRILKKLSDEAGILYTVSNGDEPGCLMELWDYVQTLGLPAHRHWKGKE